MVADGSSTMPPLLSMYPSRGCSCSAAGVWVRGKCKWVAMHPQPTWFLVSTASLRSLSCFAFTSASFTIFSTSFLSRVEAPGWAHNKHTWISPRA